MIINDKSSTKPPDVIDDDIRPDQVYAKPKIALILDALEDPSKSIQARKKSVGETPIRQSPSGYLSVTQSMRADPSVYHFTTPKSPYERDEDFPSDKSITQLPAIQTISGKEPSATKLLASPFRVSHNLEMRQEAKIL